MIKKVFCSIAIALVMAVTLVACGGSSSSNTSSGNSGGDTEEYYEFNFSMHTAKESTYGSILQEVFDEIYEKTDGHVKINIYGSATLAAAGDVADMVQSGGVDLGWIFTGFYYGEYPLSDVITMPMMGVQNVEQGTNVLWDIFEEYPEVYEEWSAYKTLMIHPNPTNYIYSSSPIDSAEELNNLSIRAVAGGTAEMLTTLGANVITMAPNDIYDSLSKNNIQAFVAEPTMIPDYSLGEVAPYKTDMGLYQAVFVVAMNWDDYNSLPAEYQAVIDEYSTREASLDYAQKLDDFVDECEADYLAQGNSYVEVSDDVVADFEEAAAKYVEEWVETYTTDTFDAAEYYEFVKDAYAKYAPAN